MKAACPSTLAFTLPAMPTSPSTPSSPQPPPYSMPTTIPFFCCPWRLNCLIISLILPSPPHLHSPPFNVLSDAPTELPHQPSSALPHVHPYHRSLALPNTESRRAASACTITARLIRGALHAAPLLYLYARPCTLLSPALEHNNCPLNYV